MAFLRGQVQSILCHHLLTLPKGHIVEVLVVSSEAHLLAQSLHILQGVHTWGEHKEHRSARTCLFVRLLKWDAPLLCVLGAKLLLNIQPAEAMHQYVVNAQQLCKSI